MRIIRYMKFSGPQLAAITDDNVIYDLPYDGLMCLVKEARVQQISLLELTKKEIAAAYMPIQKQLSQLSLLVPVEAPEVWAAGVTYERSREARNYEVGGSAAQYTYYDKVYEAERPELFFKSTAARTVGPNDSVRLRSDSKWQVPEPELGLVLDSDGAIIGYTIGNDMSCRDIEGENPLYLPQAKVWRRSCAIGPSVRLSESVADPYDMQITCRIYRKGAKAVEGTANTKQLKRKLGELVDYLKRDNELFEGTILLTGTCIVPPNEFTLAVGDRIEIDITGIGTLVNTVAM